VQISGIVKVLEANRLGTGEQGSQDHIPPDSLTRMPHMDHTPELPIDHTPTKPPVVDAVVPIKTLVTGKGITVCLLVRKAQEDGECSDVQCGPPGRVSPQLVLGLYNPLCTLQWEGPARDSKGHASLFSVAVGYNKDLVSFCKLWEEKSKGGGRAG
jgi:hypothetical protein